MFYAMALKKWLVVNVSSNPKCTKLKKKKEELNKNPNVELKKEAPSPFMWN